MMTDVRSSGVSILIDVVPEVQLMLYIRMGKRISAGVPQVRLMDVELAGSTITGDGYAVRSNVSIMEIFCSIVLSFKYIRSTGRVIWHCKGELRIVG